MTRFLQFPGVSGSYVSTEDINLLDADTAHMHQSTGNWNVSNGMANPITLKAVIPPVFGDFHNAAFSTGGTLINGDSANGVNGAPIDNSTEYTGSVHIAWSGSDGGITGKIRMQWFDDAGVNLGVTPYSPMVPINNNSFTQISLTATSHANAAFAGIQMSVEGKTFTAAVDEAFWDAACVRAGSDGTFVPSLRIVGDLDMRAKFAPTDATPATDAVMFRTLSTGNNAGFEMQLRTTGSLRIRYGTGASTISNSSDQYSFTDGGVVEVRITRAASGGAIVYYENGTQIDTDPTVAGAIEPDGINILTVGANANGEETFDGDIFFAEVRDGIDGPIVAEFDAEDVPI